MKSVLFLLLIFSSFVTAAECRQDIVAKCDSLQIVHKVCGGPGAYVNDRYSLIDEDGAKLSFYLKDGLLTSSLWNSKKHMSYNLNVLEKMDGSFMYSLKPIVEKAQALSCESLNLKKADAQTAHASGGENSAAR